MDTDSGCDEHEAWAEGQISSELKSTKKKYHWITFWVWVHHNYNYLFFKHYHQSCAREKKNYNKVFKLEAGQKRAMVDFYLNVFKKMHALLRVKQKLLWLNALEIQTGSGLFIVQIMQEQYTFAYSVIQNCLV